MVCTEQELSELVKKHGCSSEQVGLNLYRMRHRGGLVELWEAALDGSPNRCSLVGPREAWKRFFESGCRPIGRSQGF